MINLLDDTKPKRRRVALYFHNRSLPDIVYLTDKEIRVIRNCFLNGKNVLIEDEEDTHILAINITSLDMLHVE